MQILSKNTFVGWIVLLFFFCHMVITVKDVNNFTIVINKQWYFCTILIDFTSALLGNTCTQLLDSY